jgi:hypothetical protein
LERLQQQPSAGADRMIRVLAQVRGVGIKTADMLATEAVSHRLRDQRAARYGGLTGSPDESGSRCYAVPENGPAARSLVADAHHGIIVQADPRPTKYKDVGRHAQRRAPLGRVRTQNDDRSTRQTRTPPGPSTGALTPPNVFAAVRGSHLGQRSSTAPQRSTSTDHGTNRFYILFKF